MERLPPRGQQPLQACETHWSEQWDDAASSAREVAVLRSCARLACLPQLVRCAVS